MQGSFPFNFARESWNVHNIYQNTLEIKIILSMSFKRFDFPVLNNSPPQMILKTLSEWRTIKLGIPCKHLKRHHEFPLSPFPYLHQSALKSLMHMGTDTPVYKIKLCRYITIYWSETCWTIEELNLKLPTVYRPIGLEITRVLCKSMNI